MAMQILTKKFRGSSCRALFLTVLLSVVSFASASAADFSVVTVGSGGPPFTPERSRPSALIRFKERNLLVDMGIGTERRLREAGLNPGRIHALLFTHHHLDHNGEFASLFIQSRLAGGSRDIIGPPGTKEYTDFILKFYAEDMRYRAGRRGQNIADLPQVNVREIQGGETIEMDGLTIKTARMNHTLHTIAYRFESAERSIVISGDTAYSEALIALAKDANLLVVDAGAVGSSAPPSGESNASRQRRLPPGTDQRAHATLDEVATMAEKANVKKLVLTHIVAPKFDEAAGRARIRAIYSGEIIFAKDLLEIVP